MINSSATQTFQSIPHTAKKFYFQVIVRDGNLNKENANIFIGLKEIRNQQNAPGLAERSLAYVSSEAKLGQILHNGEITAECPAIQVGDVVACKVEYMKEQNEVVAKCEFTRNGDAVGKLQRLKCSKLFPTIAATISGVKFDTSIDFREFEFSLGIYNKIDNTTR